MPVVKGIMLFEALNQVSGWSEVYNITAADLNAALTSMNSLAQARCAILQSHFMITHVRVSNPVVAPTPGFIRGQRTATLQEVNLPGSFGVSTGAPDVVWTCAMVRWMDATKTVFRNQLFRGLDDSFWSSGDDKIAAANMVGFVATFTAALVAAGAVILHRIRPMLNINPVVIQSGQYQKITRRATGRPFVLLRGRR
jgi:hypothetical protein